MHTISKRSGQQSLLIRWGSRSCTRIKVRMRSCAAPSRPPSTCAAISVRPCIAASAPPKTPVSSGFRTQLKSDGVTCALPSVTALLQDFRKVSFQREIEFTSTSLCADSVADIYCHVVFLSPPVYKVNVRNEAVWAHRRNKCVVAAIQSNGAMIWKR